MFSVGKIQKLLNECDCQKDVKECNSNGCEIYERCKYRKAIHDAKIIIARRSEETNRSE